MSRRSKHNPSDSLPSPWYRGVGNDHKQELRDAVSSPAAQRTLQQVLIHIDHMIETAEHELFSDNAYALPAWAEHTADKIGARRALQEARSFIKNAMYGE